MKRNYSKLISVAAALVIVLTFFAFPTPVYAGAQLPVGEQIAYAVFQNSGGNVGAQIGSDSSPVTVSAGQNVFVCIQQNFTKQLKKYSMGGQWRTWGGTWQSMAAIGAGSSTAWEYWNSSYDDHTLNAIAAHFGDTTQGTYTFESDYVGYTGNYPTTGVGKAETWFVIQAPDTNAAQYEIQWYDISNNIALTPTIRVDVRTPIVAPTVTTQAATSVEATTATGNGTITATGGENATRRGFCYMVGTSGDPTTADSVAYTDGSFTTGAYTQAITGLTPGTNYRVRAYAVNSAGTGYGSTVQILTKPAAPTGVSATDGTYTDKVVVTWTKSTGATGYRVYRGGVDVSGLLGDVATYDDTGAAAPTITPGTASATDGSSTSYVTLSVSGESASNGTTHTYKVVASNATGNSVDSATDTGYRGTTTLTYQWQRSSGDSDADYSNISGATTDPYNDTGAPAPTITPGTASASDGTYAAYVALSLSGQSANNGAGRYFKCVISMTGASNATTTADRGYRGVGSLTYQWQRSAADSDAAYSDIGGATTASYDDTGAPADGSGRYYKCVLNATGASQQTSTADRGYRSVAPNISNTPEDYDFGTLDEGGTYETPGGLTTAYFTITNNSGYAVNITISATDMTGGTTWTLSPTAEPGTDTYGLKAGLEGGSYSITVTTGSATLKSGLANGATQRWGLQFLAPTTMSDIGAKSGTVTLTATQA